MFVIYNNLGLVITLPAGFVSLIIAGRMASGDPAEARRYLPFVFGGMLLVTDLLVRAFRWRTIVDEGRKPTILTRHGYEAPPHRPAREVLAALLGHEAGGQFFFVPVWLIGVALIVWGQWVKMASAVSSPEQFT